MISFVRAGRTGLALATLSLLLAGCGDRYWFGGGNSGPRLQGERIPVLLQDAALEADSRLADQKILLPPPEPIAAWPQAGGTADHALHHIAAADRLAQAWRVDAGTGAGSSRRLLAPPVVAEGRIFVLDAESTVRAFDAANGRALWTAVLAPEEEDDTTFNGGLAVDGGRVFAATGFTDVVALDAATGAEIWRQNLPAPMHAPPSVAQGRVFVVTVDSQAFALASDDGRVLWNHTGIAEPTTILGGANPAVDAGAVVVPYSSGEVFAFKVENGTEIWADSLTPVRRTESVARLSDVRARPVIDRGRVFVISNGGLMVAIDLRLGRRLWEREIGGIQMPWVAGDYIYVLTTDNQLLALTRDDGRIRWVLPLVRWEDEEDREGAIIWSGPILVGDRLIVAGSHGVAVAVSPYTGKILSQEELPDGIAQPPVVADGTVYFLTEDADLFAYR